MMDAPEPLSEEEEEALHTHWLAARKRALTTLRRTYYGAVLPFIRSRPPDDPEALAMRRDFEAEAEAVFELLRTGPPR